MFSLLNTNSGMDVTTPMMGRHHQGTYATFFLRWIALCMALPARDGVANRKFFLTEAVMGVSTNPGLKSMTLTPASASLFLRPCRKTLTPPFAAP